MGLGELGEWCSIVQIHQELIMRGKPTARERGKGARRKGKKKKGKTRENVELSIKKKGRALAGRLFN